MCSAGHWLWLLVGPAELSKGLKSEAVSSIYSGIRTEHGEIALCRCVVMTEYGYVSICSLSKLFPDGRPLVGFIATMDRHSASSTHQKENRTMETRTGSGTPSSSGVNPFDVFFRTLNGINIFFAISTRQDLTLGSGRAKRPSVIRPARH